MSLQPGPDPEDESALTPEAPGPEGPTAGHAPTSEDATSPTASEQPPPPPLQEPSGPWAAPPAAPPLGDGWAAAAPPAPPGGSWGSPPPPPPGYGFPPPGPGGGHLGPPPSYPPAGYPPPGYQAVGYPGPSQTDSKAVIALVLAISSWMLCPLVAAIAALVLASQSNRAIAASGGQLEGRSMNTATRVISWLNIALSVLALIAAVALMVFLATTDSTVFTEITDQSTQF